MQCGAAHHTDPLFQESLPDYFFYCDADVPLLFTENETNNQRLFGSANASPYVKDAFHNFVVHDDTTAVNPAQVGTKAAAHYMLNVARRRDAGDPAATERGSGEQPSTQSFGDFDAIFAARLAEANAFYDSITAPAVRRDPGPRQRHAPGARRHAVDQAVFLL